MGFCFSMNLDAHEFVMYQSMLQMKKKMPFLADGSQSGSISRKAGLPRPVLSPARRWTRQLAFNDMTSGFKRPSDS